MGVAFDMVGFRATYPQFCKVSDAALTQYFGLSTLYLNNTCSVVHDAGQQSMLLNLLVAHIATLYNGADGAGASGLIGRVSGATEGSVSVQVEMPTQSAAAAWFTQTQPGLMFWTATVQYRTMHYRAPPPRTFGNWGYGR